jgi:hypothetical protein
MLAAYGGDVSMLSTVARDWVEAGGDGFPSVLRLAQVMADRERSVRAAVIADLRGLVDRSYPCSDGDHVSAGSVELLIDTLEAL